MMKPPDQPASSKFRDNELEAVVSFSGCRSVVERQ
jgi:hypothetical protein